MSRRFRTRSIFLQHVSRPSGLRSANLTSGGLLCLHPSHGQRAGRGRARTGQAAGGFPPTRHRSSDGYVPPRAWGTSHRGAVMEAPPTCCLLDTPHTLPRATGLLEGPSLLEMLDPSGVAPGKAARELRPGGSKWMRRGGGSPPRDRPGQSTEEAANEDGRPQGRRRKTRLPGLRGPGGCGRPGRARPRSVAPGRTRGLCC